MLKIQTELKTDEIWVGDMKDGDVGVILNHPMWDYKGGIVQRYEDYLISLGAHSNQGWEIAWNTDGCQFSKEFTVRLLRKGETLIVA